MFRIVAFIGEAAERFSGFLKLLYPHGEFDKEAVRESAWDMSWKYAGG